MLLKYKKLLRLISKKLKNLVANYTLFRRYRNIPNRYLQPHTVVFDKENRGNEGWKMVKLGDFIKFVEGKKVEELFDVRIERTDKVLLLDALEDDKFKFAKIGKHIQTKLADL